MCVSYVRVFSGDHLCEFAMAVPSVGASAIGMLGVFLCMSV